MKNSALEDKQRQQHLKDSGEIPTHIAIIMDGNGRWAKNKGANRFSGHKEGVNSVRDIVEAAGELGVKYLTLYTFSTENWKRPKTEVSLLMQLLIKSLRSETERLHKNDVKLISTGDLDALPQQVRKELKESMDKTKSNKRLTLNLALSYSGRWEIVNAVKKIVQKCSSGSLRESDINEKIFADNLTTAGIPDPELLIRTGGDLRISNFLLWQSAYSEIYIDEVFWPEFKRNRFYKAIAEYQKRERRFGLVSEQVKKNDTKEINTVAI